MPKDVKEAAEKYAKVTLGTSEQVKMAFKFIQFQIFSNSLGIKINYTVNNEKM